MEHQVQEAFQDWQMEIISQFFGYLEEANKLSSETDSSTWRARKDGKFQVKSCYEVLMALLMKEAYCPGMQSETLLNPCYIAAKETRLKKRT